MNLSLLPTLPETTTDRSLTDADLKYAMLKTIAQYPDMYEHKCAVISTTMSEALDSVTPRFYKAFMSRYTGIS